MKFIQVGNNKTYIRQSEDKLAINFQMFAKDNYWFICTVNNKFSIGRNVYNRIVQDVYRTTCGLLKCIKSIKFQ